MTLPPEKWPVGMPFGFPDDKDDQPVRVVTGHKTGGVEFRYQGESTRHVFVFEVMGEARPLTYSDFNRTPSEGERAVLVNDETDWAVGGVWEFIGAFDCGGWWRTEGGSEKIYWEHSSLSPVDPPEGSLACVKCAACGKRPCRTPSECMPVEAEESAVLGMEYEPDADLSACRLCGEHCCKPGDTICSPCMMREVEPPAPSSCSRAAAARREWDADFGSTPPRYRANGMTPLSSLDPREYMAKAEAHLAKWRPRLAEFEPCGDCPPCLAEASRLFDGLQQIAKAFNPTHCSHGWRKGTACPSCPGGVAGGRT